MLLTMAVFHEPMLPLKADAPENMYSLTMMVVSCATQIIGGGTVPKTDGNSAVTVPAERAAAKVERLT